MAPKEVAIIGAGAGGASAAYFLKQYASETGANVNVTIFERNPYIGGRSTTVNAWDDPTEPVELGASIFVEVNKNLVKAAKDFNLSTNVMSETPSSSNGPRLGVWNGKEFVLQVSANDDWWSKAKLLYRYGWAPIKTNRLMKEVVGNFLRMYDAPYFPWSSLSETLSELGLIKTTGITGEQYLKENGVGDLFANEIIQASTRVNYAQNLPLIHGVETMVCMATNGAMSVDGGNWQIFDRMARSAAKAIHLNTNVTALRKLSDGAFKVQWKAAGASADATASTKRFDSVVLAAPYQFSNIDLDPSTSKVPDSIPYVELHVTLFASPHLLSPAAFNLASDAVVPQVVLTTLQPNERPGTNPHYESKAGFFSISTLRVAQNPNTHPTRKEYIYKIFSHKPVPTNFIAKILGLSLYDANQEISDNDVSWILRKIWKSYPYEYPRVTFEELKLDENLWYTSGIESFISTMETSSLMGMNIAKLIVDQWSREIERADNSTVTFDFAGQQQQPLKAKL
ncbi:MAG: hypothetical protein M1821_009627 [Bathelium mastoideum]|nr:MAG: hypothetical protein M1821_009627 [Bathelium mastoideum]KAI9688853.1 MAG: hypothetical protein M1822_001210 [Bathelium mastoideum]